LRARAVILLAATELWERFTHYGLRALLVLFFIAPVAAGGMGLEDARASSIYGLFVAGVYLCALPGGWLADRYLGPVRAIWLGGALIALGNFSLVFAHSLATFGTGLTVIALGVGLLKANVTALVARAAARESMPPDAAFTLFYIGINIGAVGGPLVSAALAVATGWRGGFAASAAGMLLGLAAFSRVAESFPEGDVLGKAARKRPESLLWVGTGVVAALLALVCWLVPVTVLLRAAIVLVASTALVGFAVLVRVAKAPEERRRVWLMIILFLGATVFWAAEEQAGVSFTLFAERFTDRSVFGRQFPTAWFQSAYPFFVVLCAPFFVWLWAKLARQRREPSNVLKFALGLLTAGAALCIATCAALKAGSGSVGPAWLGVTYLLLAVGEILISPVGLAAGTQLAPAGHVGFSTGLWYLSLSLGGLLAGLMGGLFDFGQSSGLAYAFASVGLALGLAGVGFLSAALLMKRQVARNADSRAVAEG
jgi:proton-dependent oligopeptide transporter, POT family